MLARVRKIALGFCVLHTAATVAVIVHELAMVSYYTRRNQRNVT